MTTLDGEILEVADIPSDERQLARGTLIPPLVNAHTHLEFSSLRAPIQPPLPFPDWIRAVVGWRRKQNPSEIRAAIRSGVNETTAAGCQLVGEICTSEDAHQHLVRCCVGPSPKVISFREVLGFSADRIQQQMKLLTDHATEHHDSVLPGISPHAPYSTHPDLVQSAVALAASRNVPVAMHIAETLDERQLLESQSGPFREFLEQIGMWDDTVLRSGGSPLDYLQMLNQAPHALAVHCNYLSPHEIRFLAQHPSIAVVFCARTHRWFQHTAHPVRELIDAGATVILGTDGRASNPDLSVWDELTSVSRLLKQPVWELLPMISTRAANALGENYKWNCRVGQQLNGRLALTTADSLEELNRQLIQIRGHQFVEA